MDTWRKGTDDGATVEVLRKAGKLGDDPGRMPKESSLVVLIGIGGRRDTQAK